MDQQTKKSINFWPYAVICCLTLMGVINFLVFNFAQTVNSPPISNSPYDDSLKLNSIREEEKCSKDLGIDFNIEENLGTLIIKQKFNSEIVNTSRINIINISGWSTSGKNINVQNSNLEDEIFNISANDIELKKGYWYFKINGSLEDCNTSCCNWTVVKDKISL